MGYPAQGPPRAGNLFNLFIRAGHTIGQPLFIDNIKLLDYPPGALPPSSPGGSQGNF